MRRTGSRPPPVGSRIVLFGLVVWPALALAQAASPGAVLPPRPSLPGAPSVIVPHAGIDPRMRVRPPRLPHGSLVVIKPRALPTPGSNAVVVPR